MYWFVPINNQKNIYKNFVMVIRDVVFIETNNSFGNTIVTHLFSSKRNKLIEKFEVTIVHVLR